MSLRKFISLLLLVSFVMTTASPVFAATSIAVSESTLPTLAEDDGTVASQGANRDVVPANIVISVSGDASDVTFCGGNSSLTGATNGNYLVTDGAGRVLVDNGGVQKAWFATQCVAGIKPPTGTKFVKLAGASTPYDNVTVNGNIYQADNNGEFLRNVSQNKDQVLPGAGTNGDIIIASVLDSQASSALFGNNATKLPAGSIVLNFLTTLKAKQNSTSSLSSTSAVNFTLTGIGLATDGNGNLADSGTLSATFIPPANGSSNGQNALPGLASDDSYTFNVATLAATGDKLEVITVGTDVGNDPDPTVEPDNKPNTLLASLVTGTTVQIGPGEFTKGGTTGYLDTDALVIRAKERPDSKSSAVTYYETPFATSKAVFSGGKLSNSGTNADILQTTALTDSSVFPNTSDALITVVFSLEDATGTVSTAGSSSSATLAVNAVNVTLHGARAFDGIRATGNTVGGEGASVASPKGFLGAAINFENGTTSGYNHYTALVLYNGASTIVNYDVADVSVLDHDALADRHGVTTANTYSKVKRTSATAVTNGSTAGIFPGSIVTQGATAAAVDVATTGNYDVVNTVNGLAASSSHTASFSGVSNAGINSLLATPTDLTARLLNGAAGASIGNTAWFILSGNDNGGSMIAAGDVEVYNTDPGSYDYYTGFTAQTSDETSDGLNNVIAAAELEGATLKILPVTNKYDAIRDALSIRPEITVTLDDASKAAGVKLIATVSGNNIASTTRIVMGHILASGTFDPGIDLTASALPVHGDMSSNLDLMAESNGDAGASRAKLRISDITGASSTTDELTDKIATGSVLDTTTPPLFCGGTAGTTTRGPNGLVIQPKARAIMMTEADATGFAAIEDLGTNAVIRFTLPAGWDINEYTATASDIIGIETSGGLVATIDRVEPISTTVSQAFVDVSSVNSSSVTQSSFNRILALFFKPHALLIPEGTEDFNVTVAVYDDKGTAAFTDDVLVGTLGTVTMADACSTFLEVAFCPDKLSDFDDSTVSTPTANSVESTHVTRGARETTYASAIGPALRLVESTPENITLPDLCITEGVADAFPLGSHSSPGVAGTPTTFGDEANTVVSIHMATNFAGDSTVGKVGLTFNAAVAATSILFSDGSIEADSGLTQLGDNEVYFDIDTRSLTGNNLPFEETTRIRVPGLSLNAPSSAKSFTAQDIVVWVEAGPTSGQKSAIIGSSLARSINEVTASTNEYFLNPFNGGSADGKAMRNLFYSKTVDTTSTTPTNVNWGDNDTTADNDITVVLAGGNPATLSDATRSEVDSISNFLELDGDTKISVLTSAITGTTAVNAQVSVGPGTLEPGTLITVDGTVDDVIVPVLADGSFQANIRCSAGTSINLSQAPDSGAITTPALGSATCDDANVDPILLSATFIDSGLGTLTRRGDVPVVFEISASGKLDGEDFVPTADQLTLGGNPVVAVDGTTDRFIGILDFDKASGTVVATTAGDGSEVTLDVSDTAELPTLSGRKPQLQKVKLNRKDRLILKGRRLGNRGLAHFILDDGSTEAIDLVRRNRNDARRSRRRGENGDTIPSNATHAVFHIPGRGMSTVAID